MAERTSYKLQSLGLHKIRMFRFAGASCSISVRHDSSSTSLFVMVFASLVCKRNYMVSLLLLESVFNNICCSIIRTLVVTWIWLRGEMRPEVTFMKISKYLSLTRVRSEEGCVIANVPWEIHGKKSRPE